MPLIRDHFSFSWKNGGCVVLILSSSSREVNTCVIISAGCLSKDAIRQVSRRHQEKPFSRTVGRPEWEASCAFSYRSPTPARAEGYLKRCRGSPTRYKPYNVHAKIKHCFGLKPYYNVCIIGMKHVGQSMEIYSGWFKHMSVREHNGKCTIPLNLSFLKGCCSHTYLIIPHKNLYLVGRWVQYYKWAKVLLVLNGSFTPAVHLLPTGRGTQLKAHPGQRYL